jgi:hypothetical protein
MSAFATAAPCPSGPWLPRRVTKSRHHPAAAQKQQQQAAYTAVDTSSRYRVFTPPLLDVRNLLAGDPPTPQQIAAVQRECEATGFLAITGHGISSQQLAALFTAARQLFDLPLETKLQQMVVSDMQAGRGYEISPEHKAYMQVCLSTLSTQASHTSRPLQLAALARRPSL